MRILALAICSALVLSVAAAPAVVAGPSNDAKLAQNRIDLAAAAYASAVARWKVGTTTVDSVGAWSVRWLIAQRELPSKGKALKAALVDHLARMKDIEAQATEMVNAGKLAPTEREAATYFVAEAELWAARGK